MKDVTSWQAKGFGGGEWDIPSGTQKISAEKTSAGKRGRKEGSNSRTIRSLTRNERKAKDHLGFLKDLAVRSHYNSVRVNMKGLIDEVSFPSSSIIMFAVRFYLSCLILLLFLFSFKSCSSCLGVNIVFHL